MSFNTGRPMTQQRKDQKQDWISPFQRLKSAQGLQQMGRRALAQAQALQQSSNNALAKNDKAKNALKRRLQTNDLGSQLGQHGHEANLVPVEQAVQFLQNQNNLGNPSRQLNNFASHPQIGASSGNYTNTYEYINEPMINNQNVLQTSADSMPAGAAGAEHRSSSSLSKVALGGQGEVRNCESGLLHGGPSTHGHKIDQTSHLSSIKSDNPLSQFNELEKMKGFQNLPNKQFKMGVKVVHQRQNIVQSQKWPIRQNFYRNSSIEIFANRKVITNPLASSNRVNSNSNTGMIGTAAQARGSQKGFSSFKSPASQHSNVSFNFTQGQPNPQKLAMQQNGSMQIQTSDPRPTPQDDMVDQFANATYPLGLMNQFGPQREPKIVNLEAPIQPKFNKNHLKRVQRVIKERTRTGTQKIGK